MLVNSLVNLDESFVFFLNISKLLFSISSSFVPSNSLPKIFVL